jgi:phospholipase A1
VFAPTDEAGEKPASGPGGYSYLSQLWELNETEQRGLYPFVAHRSNYAMPITYNSLPNEAPIRAATGQGLKDAEFTFQISQKVKVWEGVFDRDMDLWCAYTQRSFWQAYNWADSSPFRETNYEPEVLLNFRMNRRFLGFNARTITVGINHQSNGQSLPLSRSWNRIVASVGLERDNLTLLLKAWCRIPERQSADDNPDISDYMGPGEIWAYYFYKSHRFGLMLRNNFNCHENRGALQLEWSFPIVRRISGYVQFFTGYGESLVDYNHSTNRVGIGFILRDWD